MNTSCSVLFRLFLGLFILVGTVLANDNNNDDGNYNNNNDDGGAGNDDAAAQQYDANDDGNVNYEQGDDYIKYWTEYAILPKRCIVYNDVDVIVFSVFEHGYKQCSDDPMGTYIVPVPLYLQAYLQQKAQDEVDQGNDDYATPDESMYAECQRQVIENEEYYLQMGCTDGTSQSLSVNIYSDNTCTTRDTENGFDDANIDVSDIQVPFKNCQACVNWVDVLDDQIDDQFYENRQINAPLCSTTWMYKESCDRKCQKTGLEKTIKEGWNTSDKILLAILSVFGAVMLVGILQKRTKMSNKDALLEQAAMSAAGLQQGHVIGLFILSVIVITVFGLLGMKNITWALLLMMNTALFGYLMKLTIDSGVSTGETIIGPDGTIIRRTDSDDSSIESSRASGNYAGPTII